MVDIDEFSFSVVRPEGLFLRRLSSNGRTVDVIGITCMNDRPGLHRGP